MEISVLFLFLFFSTLQSQWDRKKWIYSTATQRVVFKWPFILFVCSDPGQTVLSEWLSPAILRCVDGKLTFPHSHRPCRLTAPWVLLLCSTLPGAAAEEEPRVWILMDAQWRERAAYIELRGTRDLIKDLIKMPERKEKPPSLIFNLINFFVHTFRNTDERW